MNIKLTPELICDMIAIHGKDNAQEECKKMFSDIIDEAFEDGKVKQELDRRKTERKRLGL